MSLLRFKLKRLPQEFYVSQFKTTVAVF